jgi:Carboxypeptidase regulatory-like domain/TonB dependent receptor/TonB-dependent Receptor Plug Domain
MSTSTSVSIGRRPCRFLWFSLLVAIVALPALLLAQGYFGTISGVLSDPSGAVVPGAKVTLSDEQRGFTFNATSDSEGRYLFVSIPPGLYSVAAVAAGFEKTVRAHVKLNVSENPVANLTLKVGSDIQQVKVEAQSQAIATEDAVTGQVVDRRYINDLPLIDRNVMDLTYLAPGVTDVDDQCPNCGGTNFVSNGSRGASADILMDGASITNFEPNGGVTQAVYVPSPEAVEEFKVQQTNFSAEYGFSGASVLNMVTRSGTNSFHGSLYDFIRNTITDANNWFNDASGIPIPPVHRHDFGATLGGPIIKNKTFFFFDYEGVRQSYMGTYQAGVPSAAMRTGDFGEICTSQGGQFDTTGMCTMGGQPFNAGQLWDPYSGSYSSVDGGPVRNAIIPYNQINNYTSPGSPFLPASLQPTPGAPGNLIDPVAQNVLNLFPLPTPGMANATIYDNWIASGATSNPNDQFDIKIDQRFTQKNLVSAKYSQEWTSTVPFDCFGTLIDPCGSGPNKSTAHIFAINDAYSLRPTMLLTTTFGITRGAMLIFAYNPKLGANPLNTLGFPSYLETNGFNGVPAMFMNDYFAAGFPNAGGNPYDNYKQGQLTGQLGVTLSKIQGPHEIKFGFEGRLHQQNYIQTNAPLGYFQFDNRGSSLCPSIEPASQCSDGNTPGGDSMASFLMGQLTGGGASYYEIQFRPATENYQYAWFVQDNWKATPKVTLNMGLRYDVTLPRTDRYNRQNWFDPTAVNPLNNGTITYNDPITLSPVTRPLLGGEVFANSSTRTNYVTDWTDLQPRFGLAFQFAPKMVLRGGYGIYYGQSRSGASGVVPYGGQGYNQYTNVIPLYEQGSNPGSVPWIHLNDPFPNGLIQPPGSALGLLNDVGYGANGPLRTHAANLTPYEQSWSLGIERQLPSNIVFDVEYLGKKGTHLPFSGANTLDILGPWVEQYQGNTPQMNQLNSLYTNPNVGPCAPMCNPFYGVITDPNSSMTYSVPGYQLDTPYPQFNSVTTDVQMIANSIYHGVQLTARKAFSNGLEFLVNYTWSKSIDDASVGDDNVTWLGSFTSLQDPNKPWLERSLSTFDIPSLLKFSYSYDLPFGRGRMFGGNMPRFLDLIVGGWKTNGIWNIASGRPLPITVSNGGTPIPTYGGQRPNLVGVPKRNYASGWQYDFFANPQVFEQPAPFTLGNMERTISSVRSPLTFTSDLSVGKQFLLSGKHENLNLEVRLEAQNAFNHPLFSMGTPGPYGSSTLNVGDPSFGVISSMAPIGPRQMQLAAKINF